MKTNRKTRPQPSLASLTADEYHQLADMVCTRTYEDVRQQVNKTRAEGGFDLNISIKPLQVLHARVQRLNKINEQLAAGQKLTLAQLDTLTTISEHRAPEEIHDAIMSATYILVTEHDNTPHQLLALQRLADFPERAALRAQSAEDMSRLREQSAQIRAERMEITRSKEKRAQAKAQREAEMHTHKIQMDHIRVFLKFNNRGETSFNGGTSSGGGTRSPSPTSNSRDAITNNDAAPADPYLSSETPSASESELDSPTKNSKLKIQNSNAAASSFLSPAVLANTNLYDQKIDAGEIRVIYAPGKHYEIEYCNPADQPALERMHKSAPLRFFEDPTRTKWLPGLRTFGKNPYIPPSAGSASSSSFASFHGTDSTPQTIPSKTDL